MGDAKRRLRNIIAQENRCIYCPSLPTTIDHVPPKMMFASKLRPKGLEFAACHACNEGTKAADLVASMIGRATPDANSGSPDLPKIFSSVRNNYPGLLEELVPTTEQQMQAAQVLLNARLVSVRGERVSRLMQQFSTKLIFALFREVSGRPVPADAGVLVRWFSNFDHVQGHIPGDLFENLLPLQTLAQGKFEVSDQFAYSYEISEDNSIARFVATFREAFLVAGFVAPLSTLSDVAGSPVRSGELLTLGV